MEAHLGLEIYRASDTIDGSVGVYGSFVGVLVASEKAGKTPTDL
jgi:hypothetical protein